MNERRIGAAASRRAHRCRTSTPPDAGASERARGPHERRSIGGWSGGRENRDLARAIVAVALRRRRGYWRSSARRARRRPGRCRASSAPTRERSGGAPDNRRESRSPWTHSRPRSRQRGGARRDPSSTPGLRKRMSVGRAAIRECLSRSAESGRSAATIYWVMNPIFPA